MCFRIEVGTERGMRRRIRRLEPEEKKIELRKKKERQQFKLRTLEIKDIVKFCLRKTNEPSIGEITGIHGNYLVLEILTREKQHVFVPTVDCRLVDRWHEEGEFYFGTTMSYGVAATLHWATMSRYPVNVYYETTPNNFDLLTGCPYVSEYELYLADFSESFLLKTFEIVGIGLPEDGKMLYHAKRFNIGEFEAFQANSLRTCDDW